MSNTIYTSEKVLPYVYIGTHKITGQFYIGYRANKNNQKLPSHLDLGIKYFTSSKRVKDELGFENFNWVIIAEFFEGKDAYQFEQELIGIYLRDPLNLNEHHDSTGSFNRSGLKDSQETKNRKSLAQKERTDTPGMLGKTHTSETRLKIGDGQRNISKTEEAKQKMRKPKTEEAKKNMSLAQSGLKKGPQQIVQCPYCLRSGGITNFNRFHFENCKDAPIPKPRTKLTKTDKKLQQFENQKGHTYNTGKIWINNGLVNKRIYSHQEKPEGFEMGRLPFKCNYKTVICPYCGKSGSGPNMKRYHYDNCKSRALSIIEF